MSAQVTLWGRELRFSGAWKKNICTLQINSESYQPRAVVLFFPLPISYGRFTRISTSEWTVAVAYI